MRVKSIQNIDGFFRALEKCHGRVELITDVKDVLNLASKLTVYWAYQSIQQPGHRIL